MREDFYETSVAPSNEKQQKTLLTINNVLFILDVIFFFIIGYFWLLTFDTGFIFLLVFALIFAFCTICITSNIAIYTF